MSAGRRRVLMLAAGLIAAGSAAHAQSQGIWDRRIDDDARRETFTLTSRKPNYLLVTSMRTPNQAPYAVAGESEPLDNEEVKFQLALQTKVADDLFGANADLWFGYTQVSFWQVFNGAISAPFRETNYEPEAYVSFLTGYDLFGLKLRSVNLGFVHQSNGRAEPLSRSWNRVFADFQLTRGDFALSFKPWVRIEEDPAEDNNPDIENYLGRYELRAFYSWRGQIFSAMLRNVLDSEHRLNAELSWSFPIVRRLRGLVQWYNGYGESLIDYNFNSHRIGVGVLLTDWL
ncbi:MAG TPA: phospholipase A [Burkholderiales bacterium]|nr:phospholipase A [Burkholderiales bacterium]